MSSLADMGAPEKDHTSFGHLENGIVCAYTTPTPRMPNPFNAPEMPPSPKTSWVGEPLARFVRRPLYAYE